jgi:outer membrane protein assembly factor BamB
MTYRTASGAMPLIVGFGGKVFGLDPETGKRIWAWDTGSNAAVRLAVDGGTVILLTRNFLARVEAANGVPVWQTTIPAADTLLVDGGRIFVGGAGEVRCYSMEGKLMWEDDFRGMGLGAVALGVDGKVSQSDLWG